MKGLWPHLTSTQQKWPSAEILLARWLTTYIRRISRKLREHTLLFNFLIVYYSYYSHVLKFETHLWLTHDIVMKSMNTLHYFFNLLSVGIRARHIDTLHIYEFQIKYLS